MFERLKPTPRPDVVPVLAHPHVIYLSGLIVGCLLVLLIPIGPGLARANSRAFLVGSGIAVAGAALAIWANVIILKAGSHVPTWQPTTALVTGGPYRWTRNPIYIGMLLLFFGVAVILTNLWMILVMPVMIWFLQTGVVAREEDYLSQRFGEAYEQYRARTPRWI